MSISILCGLIILVVLALLLIAGVPIAIALAISSIAAILPVLTLDATVLTGAQRIFTGVSIFSLLAIPFFILAGNIMNKGGIALYASSISRRSSQDVRPAHSRRRMSLQTCCSALSPVPAQQQHRPWVR